MAEGPANITKAIEEGIKEMMYKHPELEEVDPKLIEKWYSGLNWGPEQIAQEREEIKATHNIGITTEVAGITFMRSTRQLATESLQKYLI